VHRRPTDTHLILPALAQTNASTQREASPAATSPGPVPGPTPSRHAAWFPCDEAQGPKPVLFKPLLPARDRRPGIKERADGLWQWRPIDGQGNLIANCPQPYDGKGRSLPQSTWSRSARGSCWRVEYDEL
jgi:hypothetical protein